MFTSSAQRNAGCTVPRVENDTHYSTVILIDYIHPVTDKNSERESNRGHKGRDNLVGWRAPHRHTPNKYLRSVWFNVWALLGHTHFIAPSKVNQSLLHVFEEDFHLFWSSLCQAGVKIGVYFSSALLKVHLISQTRKEMLQRKQFNTLSGRTQNQALLK